MYAIGGAILVLFLMYWLFLDKHYWKYDNPHNRVCSRCGRWESRHQRGPAIRGWWEVTHNGDGSCDT